MQKESVSPSVQGNSSQCTCVDMEQGESVHKELRILYMPFDFDVNSSVLAWQERLAQKIVKQAGCVVTVADESRIGSYASRPNLHVIPLEGRPYGIPLRVGGYKVFGIKLKKICKKYGINACLVHMNIQRVLQFGPLLKRMGIPILYWYAHGSVPKKLRKVEQLASAVISSTAEGHSLASSKLHIIGQGIDLDFFHPMPRNENSCKLVYCGRISKRKQVDKLLDVMQELKLQAPDIPFTLDIIGPVLTLDDIAYDAKLRGRIWRDNLSDRIFMKGFIPLEFGACIYKDAFLALNLSKTGSLDKTILEPLACGCPVLTSNTAAKAVFTEHPALILENDTPEYVAERIIQLRAQKLPAQDSLCKHIVGFHDLDSYVGKVLTIMEGMLPSAGKP